MTTGADDVVRRWNPHGWARLHEPASRVVRVVGVAGSGAGALCHELGRIGDVAVVRDGPAPVALVVLDASAVIGRTELELLAATALTATEVVCVLTGIDRYPAWRSIRDRDVDLLHRHANFLEWITLLPVSVERSRRARAIGGDAGSVLLIEAGITELHDVLAAAVDAATDPRRARRAVLAQTQRMIRDEMDSLRAGDDTGGLRAERKRLAASSLPVLPVAELPRVRVVLLQEVAREIRGVATAMRDVVDDTVCVAEDVAAALDTHLVGVRARVVANLAARTDSDPRADDSALPQAAFSPLPDVGRALEDRLTVVLGASAGAGLGRLLVTPFGNIPDVAAVAVALGGAIPAAWWLVHVRRRIAHRERVRRWVGEELATARAELEAWVRTRTYELESQAVSAARSAQDARAARRRERLAALDDEIGRLAGERRARITACERDLAALGHPRETSTNREPGGRAVRRTGQEHDSASDDLGWVGGI